jgi:CRP-like cAMP-binding protein
MLKSCLRPYLLLPGQAIASLGQGRVFYVVYGRISAKNGVETLELGPGAFFSKDAVFASCRKVDWARADTYANLVVASRAQLEALIELQPRIRTGLENEPQRRQRRQSRKEKRAGAHAAAEDA